MWIVYVTETTKACRRFVKCRGGWVDAEFKRRADAERFIREKGMEGVSIADEQEFRTSIEKTEVRIGIGPCAGKEFVVPVNTPWTCGPWSETYWSS